LELVEVKSPFSILLRIDLILPILPSLRNLPRFPPRQAVYCRNEISKNSVISFWTFLGAGAKIPQLGQNRLFHYFPRFHISRSLWPGMSGHKLTMSFSYFPVFRSLRIQQWTLTFSCGRLPLDRTHSDVYHWKE